MLHCETLFPGSIKSGASSLVNCFQAGHRFLPSERSQLTATLPVPAGSEMDQMPKELKLDNFVEEIDAGSSLQRRAVGWLY